MLIKNHIVAVAVLTLGLLAPFNALCAAPDYQLTKTEYAAYLAKSPQLKEAENRLTQAYKKCLKGIGEEGSKWLRAEQTEWAEAREKGTFPLGKGSDAYIKGLIERADQRTAFLNSFIPLGKLMTYAEYTLAPGSNMEGTLELWEFEDSKLRMTINNVAKESLSVCNFESDKSSVSDGKLSFFSSAKPGERGIQVNIEFEDQGKKIKVIPENEESFCGLGTTLAGEYARKAGF